MMGPKKARTIRTQLRMALARTGKDPIQWLEDRIRQLEKGRKPVPKEGEVLQALCRVLGGDKKSKRRAAPARTKSSR